jgi:galactose mutarotase-like enzyme
VATLERIPLGQLEEVVLCSGDLRASFVPAAGMIGNSLTHRGDELLVQRGGLDAWRGTGRSFGLPLLHPWANRLRDWRYAAAGRAVTIDRARGIVRADENDLPIHGALAAAEDWDVVDAGADASAAWLAAALDYGRRDDRLAVFPFRHRLELELRLEGDALAIATTIEPTASDAVPLAFGWHP